MFFLCVVVLWVVAAIVVIVVVDVSVGGIEKREFGGGRGVVGP